MKKIWLLISLLMCWILFTWCFEKNKERENEDINHNVDTPEQMISDCKNMIKNEFWNTEYKFSWDINYHSGVYFNYSIVTGFVYFNYKTRPFLCLYEWDKSIIDIVDYVKDDGENIDLSYLQSLYNDLRQENWDEQRTNAESIFDLLISHKEFKEKYLNKDMRNIIRNIAFQNWVTEDDLVDSDNYYNQVLDIWRQKYNQIPFYQKEYYVELINKLLSEKWVEVYCSASVCDEITFSGNYNSQENLQNLVDDVTIVITALYANWIVFNWDFETHFPINFYYDEYIKKIDPEIINRPENIPNIENLDDVVVICHNNSINCGIDCEDWDITNKSYILPYKDGYIWYDYWWQEWWWIYLTYRDMNDLCDNIAESDTIFWYGAYIEDEEHPLTNIYTSIWNRSSRRTEEVVKILNCKPNDKNEYNGIWSGCEEELNHYIYNLIVWEEEQEYFTQRMNRFKKDLDNNKYTNYNFRREQWENCDKRINQEINELKDSLNWKELENLRLKREHECAKEYLSN